MAARPGGDAPVIGGEGCAHLISRQFAPRPARGELFGEIGDRYALDGVDGVRCFNGGQASVLLFLRQKTSPLSADGFSLFSDAPL